MIAKSVFYMAPVQGYYYIPIPHYYRMNLKVVIEEDTEDGGFIISCPALPGCHSEGETVEEALVNIRDAIQGCLAVLNDRAEENQGSRVMEIAI